MSEIKIDTNIFKRPLEKYNYTVNPIKDYTEQAATYLVARYNIPKEEAISFVRKTVKESKPSIPIIKCGMKKDNGDMEKTNIPLTDYLASIKDNRELMAPTLTTYINPDIKKSIHAKYLKYNVKRRSDNKKLAFKYKQAGDNEKRTYHDTMQKIMKIYNNSLSGGYASMSTVLYNKSGHSTLTSITRCVSSIGNAISESIISGNKHIRTPELLYNYITSIITSVNMETIDYCIKKFNLYTPTARECLDSLLESTKWYWRDNTVEQDILDYLSKLNSTQLTAITYVNDLYHIRKYNDNFLKEFFKELSKECNGITSDPIYLEKGVEGVDVLSKTINAEYIKGMNIVYSELEGTEVLSRLASTAYNISSVLAKYKMFIRTFFTTDILPISIAYVKEMMRKAILLSDTDSTCGCYMDWVEWYNGKQDFGKIGMDIGMCMSFFTTQVMDHNIKVMARNMNIPQEDFDLLKMKSEFLWTTFTPTNVSKHYFASVVMQEGNVFKEPDLELKGVHMIGSTVDQEVIKESHSMIKEIQSKISRGEKISILEYIRRVVDLEYKIIDKAKKGDIAVFSKTNLKDPSGYKQDELNSKYWNHLFWESTFANKYGSPGKPPYMIIKIPTVLNTANRLNSYIDSIEDDDIRNNFRAAMHKFKKDRLSTLYPPLGVIASRGIPKEYEPIIDYSRIVEDNLLSAYYLLETLGFYRKDGYLIHQMGYFTREEEKEEHECNEVTSTRE